MFGGRRGVGAMKRYLMPFKVEPADCQVGSTRLQPYCCAPTERWVQLITLPDLMSFDQALLLCKQSEDEWLVWVPDYGEVILHHSEFYECEDWN